MKSLTSQFAQPILAAPRFRGWRTAATLAAGLFALATTARGIDYQWIGATDTFNNPAAWSGGVVPTAADNAIVTNGGTVTISASDPLWPVLDLRTGDGTNSSGTYTMSGSAVTLSGWFRMGIQFGSTGTFNFNGGTITNSTGRTLVGEAGSGTLNMSAGNYYQSGGFISMPAGSTGKGTFNLSGGTFHVAGVANSATHDFNIGDVTGSLGVVNLSGSGTLNTMTFWLGKSGTSQGYATQTGGTVVQSTTGGADWRFGGNNVAADTNAVGIYTMSSGSFTMFNNFQIGANGSGAFYLSGGSVTTGTAGGGGGYPDVGRFVNGFGVLDISGGTFVDNTLGTLFIIGEQGTGTLNIRGGSLTNSSATNAISATAAMSIGHTATGVGVVNLINGTLNTLSVGSAGGAAASSALNFNGGTLQARGNNTTFMAGLTRAYVYPSGGTIDSQGNNITIGQPLLAPTGNGVATIPVGTAGSGYLAAPIVKISGGGGTNATAISTVSGGTLTGIIITSPGTGYTSAPTVALIGGSPTAAATLGTPTLSANSSGNLTKLGSGTLTLTGSNTYSGATIISAGALQIGNGGALSAGNVTNNGALIDNSSNAVTIAGAISGSGSVSQQGSGTLILTGANTYSGATTVTAGTLRVGNATSSGTLGSGPIANSSVIEFARTDSLVQNVPITGSGFVRQLGSGTLTLAATNSYTGITLAAGGTLALAATGSVSNSPSIVVSNGAILDVSAISSGFVLNTAQLLGGNGAVKGNVLAASGSRIAPGASAGTLVFSNNLTMGGGMTNVFELENVTTEGSGVNDEIIVAGSLNLSGLNTILITPIGGGLAAGTYKLIKYAGALTGGTANLALTNTANLGRGVSVTLSTAVTNEIDLLVTVSPASLIWRGDGSGNNWDVAISSNWLNGVSRDQFYNGDVVRFDDTATNQTVNLAVAAGPGAMVVDSTLNYVVQGAGKITGSTGLTKTNTGLLILNTANDYSGVTLITGGELRAGTGTALGGASAGTIISNSATLDVNGQNLGAEPVSVTGAGVVASGAIVSGSGTQSNALQFVTMAGNTTFGGSSRWDIRANPTGSLAGNGFNLTKEGISTIFLAGLGDTALGDVIINNGQLGLQDTTGLGNPAKALTLGAGTSLALLNVSNAVNKLTTLNNAAVYSLSGSNTLSGPVGMSGANTLDSAGGSMLDVTAAVSGNGSLIKTNTGTLILAGTNAYTGGTMIYNGTVQVGAGPGGTLGSGAVTNNGLLQFSRTDDFTFVNDVSGTNGTYLKLTASKMTLQSTNLYLAPAGGVGQVNGGALQIDPTGQLVTGGEFWVAQNASTGACVINGGTLVSSNWIAIGRNSTNALGSLTLNSGSIQKFGGGNIIMGSLGGNGTLTVNGGSISNNSAIWLGETAGQGVGVMNLNGGVVQATVVRKAATAGLTGIARFNGGTLQAVANNTPFLSGLDQALVQTNGAVLDDNGYGITVPQVLSHDPNMGASADGGLTKKGAGVTTLSGANTYSGATKVNAGTLALGQEAVLHMTFDNYSGAGVAGDIVTNTGTGGAAFNGTIIGAGASIVPGGRFGNALQIDGTYGGGNTASNIVLIPNKVINTDPAGNWTVAAWIQTSTAGAAYLYQGSNAWSSGSTMFYLNNGSTAAGGTQAGAVRYAGGFLTGTTAGLSDGNWHFIAIIGNGGTRSVYVDGGLETLAAAGLNNASAGDQVWIGGAGDTLADGQTKISGLIDEVYMYSRALSASEVATLFNYNNNGGQVLPTNTAVTVASGAKLDSGGLNQIIGSLSGPAGSSVMLGDASASGSVVTVGDGTSTSFSGVISGAGSLTKTGSGTLSLNGANTFAGTLLVNGGTLGGVGSFSGPVEIANDGLLAPGNGIGTVTINNTLTMDAGSTTVMEVNKSASTHDLVQGVTTLTYGGTLVINNVAGSFVSGDSIHLFSAASYAGAFTSISPATPGPGLTWDTSALATIGDIKVAGGGAPQITGTTVIGTNFIFSGSGGTAGAGFSVLSQTNLAIPLTNWPVISTGTFDGSGNFRVTNAIVPGTPKRFYDVRVP